METKQFDAPALYGDHHVSEVRRVLLEMEGVKEVYASSAFQVIEVTYDPEHTQAEQIEARLREMGYLDPLPIPEEPAMAIERKNGDGFFRHTMAFETTRGVISFAQRVSYSGRPLWPCPGFGVLKMDE